MTDPNPLIYMVEIKLSDRLIKFIEAKGMRPSEYCKIFLENNLFDDATTFTGPVVESMDSEDFPTISVSRAWKVPK